MSDHYHHGSSLWRRLYSPQRPWRVTVITYAEHCKALKTMERTMKPSMTVITMEKTIKPSMTVIAMEQSMKPSLTVITMEKTM